MRLVQRRATLIALITACVLATLHPAGLLAQEATPLAPLGDPLPLTATVAPPIVTEMAAPDPTTIPPTPTPTTFPAPTGTPQATEPTGTPATATEPVATRRTASVAAAETIVMSLSCTPVTSPVVIPLGQQTTMDCVIRVVAGLDLLGSVTLGATIQASTSSPTTSVTLASAASTCGQGGASLCLADLAAAGLGGDGVHFALTIHASCQLPATPNDLAVTIHAKYSARVLIPLLTVTVADTVTTVPYAVDGNSALPPVATLPGATLDFGTSSWNGSGYAPLRVTVPITITAPVTGCMSATGSVSMAGGAPLASETSVIPNGQVRLRAVSTAQPVAWGGAHEDPGALTGPRRVFLTTSTAEGDASAAVLTLDLELVPPATAAPGTYQGTISITTSAVSP